MNAIKWIEKRHAQFARAMRRKGYDVHTYSGRGMYGAICPAVTVNPTLETDVRKATRLKLTRDSMGLDIVLYVP